MIFSIYETNTSMENSIMGNCLTTCYCAGKVIQKNQALPINSIFKLPAPVTNSWPPGKHNKIGHILSLL